MIKIPNLWFVLASVQNSQRGRPGPGPGPPFRLYGHTIKSCGFSDIKSGIDVKYIYFIGKLTTFCQNDDIICIQYLNLLKNRPEEKVSFLPLKS